MKPKMKKLFLFLLLAFLFTACNSDRIFTTPSGVPQRLNPSANDSYTYDEYDIYIEPIPIATQMPTPPQVENNNTLRLSMRHPLTLNPLLNEDITVARILRLIFEPLIILDENLRPTSHLAELEFATDMSSVLLAIRPDAFWSDGAPVTSDDLIFSVDILRSAPANAIYRSNVENIASITRINARTVEIFFHRASACVGVPLGFPIIPQHHYRNQLLRSENDMNPLGNGSFLFERLTPMNGLTLVQNPTSFRQISHISEIEVLFLPDLQTELYAFDQGRIDAIYLPLTEWVRHHSVRHPRHEIFPAMYFEFIGFNFQNPVFQNLHMRQGIAQVFDSAAAVHGVYLNHAVRAITPIHPYSFIGVDVRTPGYDPTRARALLNAEPIHRPLVIIANEDNSQRISIANRLAASLNDIGVSARAEILPYEEYFSRLETGEFDLYIGGMTLSNPPDTQIFFNGGFFLDCSVLQEAFYTTAQSFFNEAAFLQSMAQFQQVFADRLPVIGLAFRHSAVLTSSRVSQNIPPASDNAFGWVNLWRIE